MMSPNVQKTLYKHLNSFIAFRFASEVSEKLYEIPEDIVLKLWDCFVQFHAPENPEFQVSLDSVVAWSRGWFGRR